MVQVGDGGFGGREVVVFESRRRAEMAALIERAGGIPISAPALREVAAGSEAPALDLASRLTAGSVDVLVVMTGVGARALAEVVSPVLPREALAAALQELPLLIARGPKPAQALRELGLSRESFVVVEPPHTYRQVTAAIAARGSFAGRRVAVLEHGAPNDELVGDLARGGAAVASVSVYKWAMPEDLSPLRDAVLAIARGPLKIALFTSRVQVDHAFAVAEDLGVSEAFRRGLAAGFVGSIGPVCSDALRAEGVTPTIEPSYAKMGHLVKEAAAFVAHADRR